MKRTAVSLLLIASLLGLVMPSAARAGTAKAEGSYRVGLVVQFSEDRVFTECIEFSQPEINGCEVLDLSALPVAYGGYGPYGQAVCAIDDVGCPAQDCFCECAGVDCEYWAYYHLAGDEWQYSIAGCSSHSVHHGDVEGWAWGSGTIGATSEVEPPVINFEELCAPPAPPAVDLYAEPEDIVAGQCSTVHWSVENAGVVTLNGEGVPPNDARYVCPEQTETFELRVFNDSGEYSYEVTVTVTQPSPTPRAAATPTRVPTATRQPTVAPPTATRFAQAPAASPSPSPTAVPSATPTYGATLVAVAATPTTALPTEESPAGSEGLGDYEEQPPTPSPTMTREHSVGLQRILLLLGVGAGTVGFGAIAFVVMLVFLTVIYFRARTHF